ncbi:hypothetical protein KP509_24G015800 [Ceratopteris richardii]|uniref:Uncharacterized protein n=1 Tax=Ceratopteris richardii TaxID=49495 RepID=A0A8T2RTH2_CERRI|nr:hypothetical protein KP509_24G015800 [Ceratopteris richardii]
MQCRMANKFWRFMYQYCKNNNIVLTYKEVLLVCCLRMDRALLNLWRNHVVCYIWINRNQQIFNKGNKDYQFSFYPGLKKIVNNCLIAINNSLPFNTQVSDVIHNLPKSQM